MEAERSTEGVDQPLRMPVACGAIGRFDRSIVDLIAAGLPGPMRVEVERDGAVLLTDRPARTWSHEMTKGHSWGRTLPPAGAAPTSWLEAAKLGDVGLVFLPSGPAIHSSTDGARGLYWLEHDAAIYFATTVDALALGTPGILTADWDTWSALLMFGVPNGPSTPFAEINRLGPETLVRMDGGRAVEHAEEWSWVAIEPAVSIADGADAVLEALRAIVARLPDEPSALCLSGGRDSRLLAALLAERGLEVTAYTVNGDSGNDREERASGAVAAALGMKHHKLTGKIDEYWPETESRGLRCDFMRLANPWLTPAHNAVAAAANGVVLDGFGGEITCDGGSYVVDSMLGPDRGDLAGAFWRAARIERAEPLEGELGVACVRRSRQRLRQAAKRFRGHPNRALLVTYWLRAMNGVAHVAYGDLGARALVEAPFVSYEVIERSLRVSLAEKSQESLRRAVTARINPDLDRIPSNHDRFQATTGLPIRRSSDEVLRGFRDVLGDGPLAPWIGEEVWASVGGHGRLGATKPRRIRRTVLGVVTYHLWLRRYGSRVRGADPADALGVARP